MSLIRNLVNRYFLSLGWRLLGKEYDDIDDHRQKSRGTLELLRWAIFVQYHYFYISIHICGMVVLVLVIERGAGHSILL